MDNAERYLKSIDRNVRKVKAAVGGILAFFTFMFAIVLIGGIYLYVNRNELAKSYYDELRRGFEQAVEKLPDKISDLKRDE